MVERGYRLASWRHLAAGAAPRLLSTCLTRINTRLTVSISPITIKAVLTLVNASVTVEEWVIRVASEAGRAVATTVLLARLALVVAGEALESFLVGALWAIRRALEVIQDQVLVNGVA